MKKLQNCPSTLAKVLAVFMLSFLTTVAWAQDKGIDIDVNLDKGRDWYNNPIVWVIGGAVFILLLVALLRGGKKGA